MTRRGFTLIEIMIAMTVSLIITGVMFFVFFSTSRNTEKGITLLDYVRQATLLLARIKGDIRSAVSDADAVTVSQTGITIKRNVGQNVVTVTYEYHAAERYVSRQEGSESKAWGKEGGGEIVGFSVLPVTELPGFYRVTVEFETPEERMNKGPGAQAAPDPPPPPAPAAGQTDGAKPVGPQRRPYHISSLVNKRSSDDSEHDAKWNYAYPK